MRDASGTKAAICYTVAGKIPPGAVFGFEELPRLTCAIYRGFWGRLWAAVRDLPTVETREALGTLRIMVICDHADYSEDDLRDAVDEVRPVGVRIIFERVDPPVPGSCANLDAARVLDEIKAGVALRALTFNGADQKCAAELLETIEKVQTR